MKHWIARLFGGGEAGAPGAPAPAAAAPAVHAPGPQPVPPEPDRGRAFWCWLTAGAATAAPTAQALPYVQLVLGELDRLIDASGDAAGLIPRVPDVIPQLLRSLRDDGASSADLARQVARDPSLVAELIREANSPFYRASGQVRTIDAALLLLGRNGLRMLLARAAFRPLLMHGGRHSRQAGPRIWSHTEQCALAASLLAPGLRADPFEAYLAGLMDDLGLSVALRLFDSVLEADTLPQDPVLVAALLARTRTLAARMALQWKLPPPIAAAILGAEGDGPSAGQPLAITLGRAERVAILRLQLDAGMLEAGDPAVDSLDAASARVLERLAPAERVS